jgi:hypothetical protein
VGLDTPLRGYSTTDPVGGIRKKSRERARCEP